MFFLFHSMYITLLEFSDQFTYIQKLYDNLLYKGNAVDMNYCLDGRKFCYNIVEYDVY